MYNSNSKKKKKEKENVKIREKYIHKNKYYIKKII